MTSYVPHTQILACDASPPQTPPFPGPFSFRPCTHSAQSFALLCTVANAFLCINKLCWRRDKTVIVWNLTREGDQYGFARRALRGHSHFVQVRDAVQNRAADSTYSGRQPCSCLPGQV